MILQRLSRQQNALRTAVSSSRCIAPSSASPPQRRWKHHVPTLTNAEQHDFVRNGVPGLLSPDAYGYAWTQYQQMMVDKLNSLTQGADYPSLELCTPEYNAQTKALVVSSARDPNQASLFNHASAAFNNHFFFKGLAIDKTPIPTTLQSHLIQSFSSLETLRKEFIATAASMFGPGFVWLVRRRHRVSAEQFQILVTYLAGSPLPGAHWRQQSLDMNTQSPQSLGGLSAPSNLPSQLTTVQNSVGSMGQYSAQGQAQKLTPPGGADVIPVLCVNTWEHVWLRDWGMGGKEMYLNRWWDRIDWSVASDLAEWESGGRNYEGRNHYISGRGQGQRQRW
ncbi:hypothetical protein W97_05942 [Coniosporium apollinis CBS 100218]|uniref:Manganese/iron superoxide dismutase C-terminal domain-containing protein n=1 Tax=Coniosporium apollinis (strain CBS 100218) TaxID=1168221 RepID=R7YYH3_CONA1|nr:uncharacterized protein W97_05942 [Coniosporium apollinis CBS 100218]EON66696.1 hypothetical protein W97_05942 [Coniosporium apollinis CBS 100218]